MERGLGKILERFWSSCKLSQKWSEEALLKRTPNVLGLIKKKQQMGKRLPGTRIQAMNLVIILSKVKIRKDIWPDNCTAELVPDCPSLPEEGWPSQCAWTLREMLVCEARGWTRCILVSCQVFHMTRGVCTGRVGEVSQVPSNSSQLTPWVCRAPVFLNSGQVCRKKWHRWATDKRWGGRSHCHGISLNFSLQAKTLGLD